MGDFDDGTARARASSYAQNVKFTRVSRTYKKKHPLTINTKMRRGQNRHLGDHNAPAFRACATTQEVEDDREETKLQVAYTNNM
jgi:hypothetical protein